MTELLFKGKEFVYNHHLSVPYCPLVPNPKKSLGDADLSGNLIIHGDNLVALKALQPHYAGKVDCIFIDPPYNTGNESWSYSDAVNSPIMRDWFSSNPVNRDDMLRHDKWLCMMYPRLRLLRELLSSRGSFWMTMDDNEMYRARAILDEIFGEQNFVATCIWHKMDSPKNTAIHFSEDHDYLVVYARDAAIWRPNLLDRSEEMLARYQNPDSDPRGPWLLSDLAARNPYSAGLYSIKTRTGRVIKGPPAGSFWRVSKERFERLDADNRIWWGETGDNRPGIKRFLSEVKQGVVPQTLWRWKDVGSTRNAKQHLSEIMAAGQDRDLFVTPKPVGLIERILDLATESDSIVLDSFAGSGTTAHSVLLANKVDNGDRKFILVEGEDYADTLTAERVRRVIAGYSFEGTQSEELYKETLTYTSLRNADKLLKHLESIENLEGHRFDAINRKVSDGVLVVTGERKVKKKTEGLGGAFTYCALGEPLDMDKLLTGKRLPSYAALGAWLFHTATGEALKRTDIDESKWYLGESAGYYVWLVYRADLEFLKSRDAALTLAMAETIAKARPVQGDKSHLVFSPAKYVPNKLLLPLHVEHAPLPFALYRVEKS